MIRRDPQLGPRTTITVVRGRRDDLTGDWLDGSTEHVVDSCLIAPTGSTEASDRSGTGDQVTTRRDIYGPPAADVRSTDRVRLPGESGPPVWEVVGDPAGWGPGTVITIERVTG